MSRYSTVGFLDVVGAAVAATVSWSLNHELGWAVFHAFLGWGYVLYAWLFRL